MSTEYPTKESALFAGMFYAGRSDLCKGKTLEECLENPEIKATDDTISQFGYVHEDATTLLFLNDNNEQVKISTTKFRNGFDLWLINPKSGSGIRT
ncbi:hypothetical protein KAT92_06250 [Candidatus Babeliales bacterium]|nr:hypothetical protein [Candidatus Babeliales bacterium]